MRRPRQVELRLARELAEVVMADVALQVLDDVLVHEHPTIDDLGEHDPPSVRAARQLVATVRALRADLRRYRAAAISHRDPDQGELPF